MQSCVYLSKISYKVYTNYKNIIMKNGYHSYSASYLGHTLFDSLVSCKLVSSTSSSLACINTSLWCIKYCDGDIGGDVECICCRGDV